MSAESLIQQLGGRRLSGKKVLKISRGKKKNSVLKTTMAAALHGTGLLSDEENQNLEDEDVLREWYDDVLSIELEREWFPNTDPRELESACRQIRETAAKSVSLGLLKEEMEKLFEGRGSSPGRSVVMSSVLRGYYHTPWELALQRWMEAVTPGVRSYVRPSRRGADRKDVILPGRKREGWTLHIILDTSGSMSSEFNRVLGSIASFCESVNVDLIHVLQCDVEVTKDDLVTPEELQSFAIAGLGGSDMSKAMLKLAEDPEVEAVVILTDGYIGYPKQPMPYAVLWVLTKPNRSFSPSYGEVLQLAPYSD
jgi:predicted metal-dependent peptidase